MSRVSHDVKACKAVVSEKGAAAEGRMLQIHPGQTEKIRLTVAFAESYVLIVEPLPSVFGGESTRSLRS